MELERLIDWRKVELPSRDYALRAVGYADEDTDKTLDDLIDDQYVTVTTN